MLRAGHRDEGPGLITDVGLCNSMVLGPGIEFKIAQPFTSQDVLGTLRTCLVDQTPRLGTALALQRRSWAWERAGSVHKSKHVRAHGPFEET